MKKDTYIAYYAFSDDIKLSKWGFKTEADAWNYVKSRVCKICKEDLKRGKINYGYGDDECIPILHVSETDCGLEWLVLKEKDFEKSQNFGDILKGAGYKKVSKGDFNEKIQKPNNTQ